MAITVVNTAVVIEETYDCKSGSRLFDASEKITWPSIAILDGAMTISLWVYATGDYSIETGTLFEIGRSGDLDIATRLSIASNTSLSFSRAGSVTNLWKSNSCADIRSAWHNIVVTGGWFTGIYDGKLPYIYLDGVLLTSDEYSSFGGGQINPGGTWSIGPNIIDYYSFQGKLCQLGVWDTELSEGQILNLASGYSPILVSPGDLQFYFPASIDSLNAWTPSGDIAGTNDGTTWGADGPDIYYG